MLIWINTSLGPAALDQGVLRAADVQSMTAADGLQAEVEVERQNLLAAAREQAEAELEEARGRIAEMMAEAGREADRVRRQAYEEGQKQAMQDWHARGIEVAVDKTEALRGTHERLAEVVTNAVERIVQSEDRATLYRRALKNVQALTRGATTLRLRVGPDDHAAALESIQGLTEVDTAGLEIDVVADAALRPGSCVFESDVGVLDASIETQLDALRAAMARAVRRASKDDDAAEAAPPGDAS